MPHRTSYSEALNSEIFRTISSEPENSFHFIDLPTNSSIIPTSNLDYSWLLPGEEVKIEEPDVGYCSYNRKVYGKVYVTNYRLRFEENQEYYAHNNEDMQNNYSSSSFDLTLGCISKVEKIGFSNVSRKEDSYGIEIICKDMRNIRFVHRPETHSRRPLYDCLRKFAFPNTNKLPFFATLYKQTFNIDGHFFSTEREFKRQNLPKDIWTLTKINQNYEFAGTYPSLFAVPTEVFSQKNGEEFLRTVSEFRSKQRIPVLSWIDSRNCAAIIRSAQPLVGMNRKSPKDEEYLEMIINANPNSNHLVVLDARPSVNAKANRAKGGGYEDYPRCELKFLNIENIHVVRESLKRLKDACYPKIDYKHFYRSLDESKWLIHIQTILDGASRVVTEIAFNRNSVLIHCSDGWDRTAQLTSLAMLQLDSYYRTIEGFAILIEKEWCSFGHKFAHRIGHGEDKHGDSERSPIFVQFIDCVWQLFNQFTSSFEFNVQFLKTILDELYACRFGTFLYNSEKERRDLEVKKNTVSLWAFILDNKTLFQNPTYDPNTSLKDFLTPTNELPLKMAPICMKLWTEYYCRYNPEVVLPENQIEKLLLTTTPIKKDLPDRDSLITNIKRQSTYDELKNLPIERNRHSTFVDRGNGINNKHCGINTGDNGTIIKESIRMRRKDFLQELQQKQIEMGSVQITKF